MSASNVTDWTDLHCEKEHRQIVSKGERMRIEFIVLQEEFPCSTLLSQMDTPYRNKNILDVFICPIERHEENRMID
jgi:hypothetical protein